MPRTPATRLAAILLVVNILCGMPSAAAESWPAAAYFGPPAHLNLVLLHGLKIPGGKDFVNYQAGQAMGQAPPAAEVPWCQLKLGALADSARAIDPQGFTVTGMNHYQRSSGKVPSAREFVSDLSLHSLAPTGVIALICQNPADAFSGNYLNLEEINAILGPYATLKISTAE